MSSFNINNVSGNGHTFGDNNQVNNNLIASHVLTRDDYYKILLEIWDIGRLSVEDYLREKYEMHIAKNPHFIELLYKDMTKIMDGVNRPEDGDLAFENGDIAVKNGNIQLTGRTNNFYDAFMWLHFKVAEARININANSVEGFIKKMEDFENFLQEDDDSPNVKRKLKDLNEQLKAERASYDEPQIHNVNANMDQINTTPKAFISYAWDDETKAWVKDFAARLRSDGIDVTIDQWSATPGDQMTLFMEKAVVENDYVLIVCTPTYKQKSDNRQGGVGYEGNIMTAEVYQKGNHRKYIPILKTGSMDNALPSWLASKLFIDLSEELSFQAGYEELVRTIYGARESAPPLGQMPAFLKNV